MKYGNAKYLVFGPEGELLENNVVTETDKNGISMSVEFNLGTLDVESPIYKYGNVSIAGTCNNLYVPGISARTKSNHFAGNDYCFFDCKIFGKQYAAIVYHDGLESNAPYLFYEWYKFYLPDRVPHCCCKRRFYKVWLPYVNKVYESIKIKFPEYGKYHIDDCVNDHYSVGSKSLNVMPTEFPTMPNGIVIDNLSKEESK